MRSCRKLAGPVLALVVLGLVAACGTASTGSAVEAARTDPATARLISEVTAVPDSLRHPGSRAGQAILTGAVFLTADLCALTADQPRSVCTPSIRSLRTQSSGN